MKKLHYILLTVLLLAGAAYLVFADRHAELTTTPFEHFQDEEQLIELVLKTDLESLLADQEDYDYQPAELMLKKNNCLDEHFHLEIKPRGVFRKANCAFPPLKIRFPDEVLAAGGFMDYPTLKLVTHCQEDPYFDQLIIKEYLVFRLYNQMTPHSFKAQLAKVTYQDVDERMPDIERYGFLIEHPRELADRLNGKILGEEYGAPKNIDLPAYKLFAVFQYMIGNTDWVLSNRHNVKLVQPKEGALKVPVPVPYDFDFCGLVDAPYAIPHHSLPIKDVTERHFQWHGGEEDFSEVFAQFRSKKEVLLATVADCTYLADSVKVDAVGYLSSFFDRLETPELITEGAE